MEEEVLVQIQARVLVRYQKLLLTTNEKYRRTNLNNAGNCYHCHGNIGRDIVSNNRSASAVPLLTSPRCRYSNILVFYSLLPNPSRTI